MPKADGRSSMCSHRFSSFEHGRGGLGRPALRPDGSVASFRALGHPCFRWFMPVYNEVATVERVVEMIDATSLPPRR